MTALNDKTPAALATALRAGAAAVALFVFAGLSVPADAANHDGHHGRNVHRERHVHRDHRDYHARGYYDYHNYNSGYGYYGAPPPGVEAPPRPGIGFGVPGFGFSID